MMYFFLKFLLAEVLYAPGSAHVQGVEVAPLFSAQTLPGVAVYAPV